MRRVAWKKSVAIAAGLWLCWQWAIHPDFTPCEISLDLQPVEAQIMLSGPWDSYPSTAYIGCMDRYVSGPDAMIRFQVSSPDIYWFRLKGIFAQPGETLTITLNRSWRATVTPERIGTAQKYAWELPRQAVVAGWNEMRLGVTGGQPVLIEKIEFRNYRAKLEEAPLFIVMDTWKPGYSWMRLRWNEWWIAVLLLLAVIGLDRVGGWFWGAVLHAHGLRWGPRFLNAGFGLAAAAAASFPIASLVSPYIITTKPWGLAVITLAGFMIVQVPALIVAIPYWIWYLATETVPRAVERALQMERRLLSFMERRMSSLSPMERQISSFVGRKASRIQNMSLWGLAVLRVAGHALFVSLAFLIIVIQEWVLAVAVALKDPRRCYRWFILCFVGAGILLIAQAAVYRFGVMDTAKIIDTHGGYPMLRRLAELVGDLGISVVIMGVIMLAIQDARSRK